MKQQRNLGDRKIRKKERLWRRQVGRLARENRSDLIPEKKKKRPGRGKGGRYTFNTEGERFR